MKVEADARLSHPRELVFRTYRDRLTEMLPYLPNIRDISQESRRDEGSVTRVVNRWSGAGDDIPRLARSVVTPEMLVWLDHAEWNESEWTCRWRIEHLSFSEQVDCSGLNHFVETPEGCTVQIRGNLKVDAKRLPGVPKMMAGAVAPVVEGFIVQAIRPNLVKTADGVAAFLNAQG
ncbi:MAG: hypothetical protein ACFB9M_06970 [Myxococcota bacterium]